MWSLAMSKGRPRSSRPVPARLVILASWAGSPPMLNSVRALHAYRLAEDLSEHAEIAVDQGGPTADSAAGSV